MDHYMNYGSAVLDWESFAISAAVVYITTLAVWCILSSMLNKDYQALNTLRQTYRDRIQQVRRRVRSVSYGAVQ